MYVDIVPNRSSPPAILLRESWREGSKIRKKTIANISHWPRFQVEALRGVLKGEHLVPVDQLFLLEGSLPHGHVEAILGTLRKLGLERILGRRQCEERTLVVAMIVEQVLHSCSKLAQTRLWETTSLGEELGVLEADENDLYRALDWLLERQGKIEGRLAKRHLGEGAFVFYDVTSSYYEGRTCPLARLGYGRDGKKGLPVIVYGTLTDGEGRPISVQVYPGNTADPLTVADQVRKLREDFGLKRVVLVGDRGMLTQTQIEVLRRYPGLGWITALRAPVIRELLAKGSLQRSLFDVQNLAEISSPDFPDERLIACYNPILAEERRRKRKELLEATEASLEKIQRQVERRTKTPLSEGEIGVKVGKVLNAYKVGKHFEITLGTNTLSWIRRSEQILQEEQLDGIYVIRTGEPRAALAASQAVRQYKNLSKVERIYRTLKGMDIRVRPIRHRTEAHVRAHIFLCLLAYYVEWHMRKALSPILFHDEELEEMSLLRDPVAKAEVSKSAKRKKRTLRTPDGLPVHSFETLLEALGTRARCLCRLRGGGADSTFIRITDPGPLHRRAFELLGLPYPVSARWN